jgi:hypothetical protein
MVDPNVPVVQSLAIADPTFAGFEESLPREVAQASVSSELLAEVVDTLRSERPELAAVKASSKSQQPLRFSIDPADPLATAGTLAAILFLLRLHLSFNKNADGQWTFLVEHKPLNNALVDKLLKVLADIVKPQK